MHSDLEREPENLELIAGNGLATWAFDLSINHPILTKRVRTEFDTQNNTIKICDTDTKPELYTHMFKNMQGINHSAILKYQEILDDEEYHPLDRKETPNFLKQLANELTSKSRFLEPDSHTSLFAQDELLHIKDEPVFFLRKRIDGALRAIESILDNLENTGAIPKTIVDLISGGIVDVAPPPAQSTIESQLAALGGESVGILLSKVANREQLEIAERSGNYNTVLVQGPPGTGKTHTVANRLGHFLAQGKSVLVTSHTRKALSVLKSQVPEELQDLCVSILDDTNRDLVSAVEGISEKLSTLSSSDLAKQIVRARNGGKQLSAVSRRQGGLSLLS
ncbi:MAG: AAA family ATPase [Eubacteriaceae bacterium]|nr:AAA family ATPase [Eubacteriaceae bacterium]